MNGARQIVNIEDFDGVASTSNADYIPAMKSPIKKIRPLDQPTSRESRRQRDMIYLILNKNLGLNADEIAVRLRDAARSPSQIRRRIAIASNSLSRQEFASCG